MRIQSPLSNLCEVLNQVKTSATQYQGTLKKNEAATRAVLVDPILQALGWDTANTFMVEVEKTLAQTRVDYALFDNNGEVRVIVEAKSLGDNLTHQTIIMSLVTYAFTYGLQDIFLTDGVVWQHFTDFQPGKVTPGKVLNLAEDNFVDCAAYLVHRLDAAKFWPETQSIDALAQQVAQLESVVSTLQQEITHLHRISTSSGKSPVNANLMESDTQAKDFAFDNRCYVELNDVPDLTKKKPVAFRLPDGSEIPVNKWRDVLLVACKYTLAENPSISLPYKDRSLRKVHLLSVAKPPVGISYVEEQYGDQTIYIYTNYSANSCVANAAYILKQVPHDKLKTTPALAFQEY